jgi:hypothetical protein
MFFFFALRPAKPAESMTPTLIRRLAISLCAFIFLVAYPLLNSFAWRYLPAFATSENGGDFSQYYSAALAVKLGIRDHLYATPNTELYSKPPTFRPKIESFLFDPSADESRSGNWAFYPQIASPEASEVSPALSAKYPSLQLNYHYLSPPPLAWLLSPLALFDYDTARRFIWFPLMCASLFGISFFSGKIARHIYQRETYVETIAILLPLVPVLMGSSQATTLAAGNVSPLLGFLITLAAYSFITDRQILFGLCVIPLVLFKGIGIMWCPILLIGGIKWRAILVMALLTLLLNAITLYHGGLAVYQTFFGEILPKSSIPLPYSVGPRGILMNLFGLDAGLWFVSIALALQAALYFWYFKVLRGGYDHGLAALTVLIGSIAIFDLFNPIVWPNYVTLYLVLPFSAWIIREISLRRGLPRILMASVAISIVLCCMDSIFVGSKSLFAGWLESQNLDSPALILLRKSLNGISLYVIPNIVSTLILGLAIKRLASMCSPRNTCVSKTASFDDPTLPTCLPASKT